MIGVAFHSPSLVSLMVDRERFVTVVVPANFDAGTQEELETLFAKKLPAATRRLLLVDRVDTLTRIAALFPEAKARVVVFDVHDRLKDVADLVIDVQEVEEQRKLVSIKPSGLNPALVRLKPTPLEDLRVDYTPEGSAEVKLAPRDGRLVAILGEAKSTFQKQAIKYIFSLTSFAALKRSGRQDKAKVLQVQQYAESDNGGNLLYAFMDLSLYGTEPKEAAVFSGADLEDLRFATSIIEPDSDLTFSYEIPEKLRIARE